MTEKTLTTENIKPALDALRGELAPWPVVAKKQDRLNTAQLNAANSGITSSLVAQIIANTAAIRALESAITGTGLRALVVASLPAIGTQGILYIVPVTTYDPATDADVVNYSNEYLWIVAPDAPVTEGYYEQVGQTGIVINNGQLTITVNGTSVGTFTANQSGDTTAAITVPTNADYVDLTTNQTVAGVKTFSSTIEGTASKAIADEDGTSIKTGYVNVAGNQTVSGQKTWSNLQTFSYGQIRIKSLSQEIGVTPSTGVIQYLEFADKNNAQHGKVGLWDYDNGASEIQISVSDKYKDGVKDSTGTSDTAFLSFGFQYNGTKFLTFSGQVNNSIIPLATNSYSLGSSPYQWSAVYAQTYYYNGTQWGLDKVNEWSETNAFTKAYSDATYSAIFGFSNLTSVHMSPLAVFFDVRGSSNYASYGAGLWAGYVSTGSVRYGHLKFVRTTDKRGETNSGTILDTNFSFIDMAFHYSMINFMESVRITNDGTENSLKPITTSVTDLGTSTNKWKTLNGVNPGALSLPDNSNAINLDTTNWRVSGNLNHYVPTINGWLCVSVKGGANNGLFLMDAVSEFGQSCYGNANETVAGRIKVALPVIASRDVLIIIHADSNADIYEAKLYPCLGNV